MTSFASRPVIVAVSGGGAPGQSRKARGDALVAWADGVARAGVDLIQLRERGLDDRHLVEVTRVIVDLAHARRVRVLLNERTDVALAAHADGVHLPAAAPAANRVRTIVPPGFLIGRSVHDVAEAEAATEGCDYLLFGTVFPSARKPGHPAAGTGLLAHVCGRVALPVFAIGGIDRTNAAKVAESGAAGVAAISLFAEPLDEEDGALSETVSLLRRAFHHSAGSG
jgi:thiamine-phosphate pyrophosphorylase